jgi:GTPase
MPASRRSSPRSARRGPRSLLAYIPGLIEGASDGRGLGHEFLRHVERARVLVLLLDLASVEERAPADQERVLLEELGRHQPDLLDRPRLVVGSKADVAQVPFDGLAVSAVTHDGVKELLGKLADMVDEARAAEPERDSFVVLRPKEEGFAVVRDDDGAWRVNGRAAERVVAMADLTNPEAVAYVQDRFRRMGVERALSRAGAREGDLVRVGPIELEYIEGFS